MTFEPSIHTNRPPCGFHTRPGANDENEERVASCRLSRVTGFFSAGSRAVAARRSTDAQVTDEEE
jgi:hypothetical protein